MSLYNFILFIDGPQRNQEIQVTYQALKLKRAQTQITSFFKNKSNHIK